MARIPKKMSERSYLERRIVELPKAPS